MVAASRKPELATIYHARVEVGGVQRQQHQTVLIFRHKRAGSTLHYAPGWFDETGRSSMCWCAPITVVADLLPATALITTTSGSPLRLPDSTPGAPLRLSVSLPAGWRWPTRCGVNFTAAGRRRHVQRSFSIPLPVAPRHYVLSSNAGQCHRFVSSSTSIVGER